MPTSTADFLGEFSVYGEPLLPGGSGKTNLYNPGKYAFLKTQVPQFWAQFAKHATGPGGPIETAATSKYKSQVGGLAAGFEAEEEHLGASLASMGADPSVAAKILSEKKATYPMQAGTIAAEVEAEKQADILGIQGGATQAITQAIQYAQGVDLEKYKAKLAAKAQKKAAQFGLIGDIIGAAAMFAAPFTAGATLPLAAGAKAASGASAGGMPGFTGASMPTLPGFTGAWNPNPSWMLGQSWYQSGMTMGGY